VKHKHQNNESELMRFDTIPDILLQQRQCDEPASYYQ